MEYNYQDIVEIDEGGLKRARELLTEGYKIVGIYQGTRLVAREDAPPFVRRGPRYVLAKYSLE